MSEPLEILLAEKVPRQQLVGPSELGRVLKGWAREIEVRWSIHISKDRWIQLRIEGPDRDFFQEVLKQQVGTRPLGLEDVRSWETYKGYVQSKNVGFGVFVDLGLASKDALYPLHGMRAQLADGKQVPARTLVRDFCLYTGVPVEVQVSRKSEDRIDVQLSDRRRQLLLDWKSDRVDRILALGVSSGRMDAVIRKSGLKPFVRGREELGLFTQVLVCRKGTEGPGIIAKLGQFLRRVPLFLFPRNLSDTT